MLSSDCRLRILLNGLYSIPQHGMREEEGDRGRRAEKESYCSDMCCS